ncbi:MAG: substrate-binding domain-containing protein [Solirubrobacteraceae bacterium]
MHDRRRSRRRHLRPARLAAAAAQWLTAIVALTEVADGDSLRPTSGHTRDRGSRHPVEERPEPAAVDREHQLQQLSVVGFDNLGIARQANPPLTTVRQPHVAKGERAGELLLKLITGQVATGHHVLDTKLIIRASTSRAPTRRRSSRAG